MVIVQVGKHRMGIQHFVFQFLGGEGGLLHYNLERAQSITHVIRSNANLHQIPVAILGTNPRVAEFAYFYQVGMADPTPDSIQCV
jgi:hypothetical protein